MNYLTDDPELWEPGMVKYIPRIYGRGYDCIITGITPTVIEFRGPIGDAAITRSLYTHLIKEQTA
jgi:hypothetical protein